MTTLDHIATALEAVARAQVSASADTVELARVSHELAGAETRIADRDTVIAAQSREIDRLNAIIADLTDGTTTRTAPLLIGATVDPRGSEGTAAATDTFERQIGAPLQVTRRFFKGLPASFNQGVILADANAGRSVILSIKTDATAAQLASAYRTLPARTGVDYWVAVHHEPDNDIKQGMLDHTPEWFAGRLAANGAAVDLVRGEGRTDIHKMAILTGWLEYDNDPGDSTPWLPKDPTGWVLGVDHYDISGRFTLAELHATILPTWRKHGGKAWAITEAGSKRTGVALANVITDAIAFCDNDPDCVAWCYYHGSQGENGPWWLDDLDGRAALGRAIQTNRAKWTA